MQWSDQKVKWFLIGFQAIFGLLVMNQFPICLDEPYSIFYAQQAVPEMMSEVMSGNNAPLHFIFLNGWIQLFGTSVWAVRGLSLLISLLTMEVLYRFARKLMSQPYSMLVVGLFIFSRLNHFVAVEARMYGLFTLFFVLLMFALYRFLAEKKGHFFWIALWNAGLFYTHYLGGAVMMMEIGLIMIFWKHFDRNQWKSMLFSMIATAVLLMPIVYWFFQRAKAFGTEGSWVAPAQIGDLWMNLVKLFNNELTFVLVILTILSTIFIQRFKRMAKDRLKLMYLIYWSLGTYVFLYVISVLFSPVFFIKYLQFLTIPFFLLVGLWLDQQTIHFKNWKRYFPLLIVLPFIFSVKYIPDVNRETDVLVEYVKTLKREGTKVYYSPPHYDLTLAYHVDKEIFEDYQQTKEILKEKDYHAIFHARDIESTAKPIIFIDFDADFLYPNNDIIQRLDQEMNFAESRTFKGDFHVYLYHP
jgi:hypothetical protein